MTCPIAINQTEFARNAHLTPVTPVCHFNPINTFINTSDTDMQFPIHVNTHNSTRKTRTPPPFPASLVRAVSKQQGTFLAFQIMVH